MSSTPPPQLIQIFVETLTGERTKHEISSSESVKSLKSRIAMKEGIPHSQQSLVYRDRVLNDWDRLDDFQIKSGAVVKLIPIARSGPLTTARQARFLAELTSDDVEHLLEFLRLQNLVEIPADVDEFLQQLKDDESVEFLASLHEKLGLTSVAMPQEQRASCSQAMADRPQTAGHRRAASLISGSECEPELDLRFTDARKKSALQRAEDNLRTMQRMRDLRRSMERLSMEKAKAKRRTKSIQESPAPSTDCSAGVAATSQRKLSTSTKANTRNLFVGVTPLRWTAGPTSAPITSKTLQFSAAEDTSAKESSAGETECDERTECYPLCPTQSVVYNATAPTSAGVATSTPFAQVRQPPHSAPPGVSNLDGTYRQVQVRRSAGHAGAVNGGTASVAARLSSSSDVDVESSAAEKDTAATSENEQHTADDYCSDEEGLFAERGGLHASVDEGTQKHRCCACGSRLSTAPAADRGEEERRVAVVDELDQDAHDVHSDWSEVSSGLIMCELSETRMRNKVRRKHPQKVAPIRRTNMLATFMAQTQALADGSEEKAVVEDDEFDEEARQPSGERTCPICKGAQRMSRTRVQMRQGRGAGAPRNQTAQMARPRSKPRAQVLKAVSTGESSSDEPEMHRENSGFFNPVSADCAASQRTKSGLSTMLRLRFPQAATTANSLSRRAQTMNGRNVRKSYSERGRNFFAPFGSPSSVAVLVGGGCSSSAFDSAAAPSGGRRGQLYSKDYASSTDDAPLGGVGVQVLAVASTQAAAVRQHRAPQSSQSQQRCNACGTKLTIANTFQCRCGKTFCSKHRTAELHSCSHDFKGEGRKLIQRDNPRVISEKLPRI